MVISKAGRDSVKARPRVHLYVCSVVIAFAAAMPVDAAAQDLFELEVFRYELAPPGGYGVEFHTNAMSKGALAPAARNANHRPLHLSVEITRGWTNRFESALFIQTAPFGSSGSARFAGGHLRAKYRIGETPHLPLGIALSAEYTFNRSAFDRELQTLEIRPILDYRQGRLWLVANPGLEIVTHGSDGGLEPSFDLSAGGGWQLLSRLALTADYFSSSATTRHLAPEVDAHHLIFAGTNINLSSRWEFRLGLGHCSTSHEPWLVKSIVGYRF
jgi:hypothetical protein